MGKARVVNAQLATRHTHVSMGSLSDINEYGWDGDFLYYAKPEYQGEYGDVGVILMGFRIRKTTECFYMLECGLRVSKGFDRKSFALTPQDAVKYCVNRTKIYFDCMFNRMKAVQEFLKQTDYMRSSRSRSTKELRIFESLAKQFEDTDDIPLELYKDLTINPELKIGDILR